MAYIRLSAAEAAAMINDQDTIGLSGFTPNGVPKATFRELSKRAVAEHEAGRPFQVGILTGASTSQSIEGDMAAARDSRDPTGAITSNSFIFVFMNAIFLFVGAKLRQNKDNTKLFKIYFML